MAQWAGSPSQGWAHSGICWQVCVCVDKTAPLVLEGHSCMFSGWFAIGYPEIALNGITGLCSMPSVRLQQNSPDMFPW